MTQADYDAIVFGSGAGGMTCALTLAQQGARTLLVEKNDWTGGYAHGCGPRFSACSSSRAS